MVVILYRRCIFPFLFTCFLPSFANYWKTKRDRMVGKKAKTKRMSSAFVELHYLGQWTRGPNEVKCSLSRFLISGGWPTEVSSKINIMQTWKSRFWEFHFPIEKWKGKVKKWTYEHVHETKEKNSQFPAFVQRLSRLLVESRTFSKDCGFSSRSCAIWFLSLSQSA